MKETGRKRENKRDGERPKERERERKQQELRERERKKERGVFSKHNISLKVFLVRSFSLITSKVINIFCFSSSLSAGLEPLLKEKDAIESEVRGGGATLYNLAKRPAPWHTPFRCLHMF